jgi:hypoxanthine phosphoribosyltransferase
MRAMRSHVQIDFMAVSSYGDETSSSGVVRILKDLNQDIAGRHVIVVEDIVDSGLTLQYLLDHLRRRDPARISVVALLRKDKQDAIDVQVDRVGFDIPDEFVVGYGLDYAGRYRNLPFIGILHEDVIQKP